MSYSIVYLDLNNKVIAVGNTPDPTEQNSLNEAERFMVNKPDSLSSIVSYVVISTENIPSDGSFIESWMFIDGKVVADLDICKTIQLAKLRYYRTLAFKKFDDQKMQFITDQAKLAEIDHEAQKLRDMFEQIDFAGCTTPQSIREYVPEELLDYSDLIKNDRGYYV